MIGGTPPSIVSLPPCSCQIDRPFRTTPGTRFLQSAEVDARFGSLERAFALIRRVTGPKEWEAIARRSIEDLLVYLALGRSRRRPPMSAPPTDLQRDIRSCFGSDSAGCRRADDPLFRAGDAAAVDDAGRRSPVGKLLPNALYVHRTALGALDPLLRVYEGCARAYLGEVKGADLIKLHRHSGKVSYLVDLDFGADPHPALLRSIKLNLRTREIESTDYAASANPPVLHRKEAFLLGDDPRRGKYERLTRQEERAGLLDETATIGTRAGWAERLRERGYALRRHRLVRCR
jgi:DNA phosphorothioation-associated putative methyltransferase